MIEVDQHVSSHSTIQEQKINHKTVLNHSHKAELKKKKLDVWVPHQLMQKNMMDQTSICEVFTKQNGIDLFHKQMGTGDEK